MFTSVHRSKGASGMSIARTTRRQIRRKMIAECNAADKHCSLLQADLVIRQLEGIIILDRRARNGGRKPKSEPLLFDLTIWKAWRLRHVLPVVLKRSENPPVWDSSHAILNNLLCRPIQREFGFVLTEEDGKLHIHVRHLTV